MPVLDAVRRTGLPLADLEPHIVTIAGEQQISVATVERLRAARLPAAKAEQDEYIAGRLSPEQRKY